MEEIGGVEVRAFPDAAAFDAWLAEHHGRHAGVWLKLAKRGSGIASVTADEVVDVGLCWGWVSGQRRALDDDHYLQKYVPRRPRSMWSRVNVDKVEALIAAGRMREPGMAEVRAARADGRWAAAYASQREATVPPDVVAALASRRGGEVALRSARPDVAVPALPPGAAGQERDSAGGASRAAPRRAAGRRRRVTGRRARST